jgi:phage terminase large subunit-like protein
MLSIRIDDAIRSDDPNMVVHCYSADMLALERDVKPEEIGPLDEEGWAAANPALGKFRSRIELEKWAKKADRMPSVENTFRNLYLNQRVNRIETFIPPSIWAKGNNEVSEEVIQRNPVWGGLDLAETTDLCAFTWGAKDQQENWHLNALFWKPERTLEEHSKRDRVNYRLWADQGFIRTTPGVAVDYEFVAHDIATIVKGLNLKGIAFDRYRFKNLQKKFEDLGIELPFFEWGQGYVSMAPAMDATEIEFLNERVLHGGNPVMRMCAANAVVIRDPAGNRKLDKSKSTGRIDGMVAMVMMMGLAGLPQEEEEVNIYEERGMVLL